MKRGNKKGTFHHSEEAKRKIRLARKGKPLSKEHKEAIRLDKRGITNLKTVKIKHLYMILITSFMLSIIYEPINILSLGPNDPENYEIGETDIFTNPIGTISAPFEAVLGVYVYPVVWGVILGFLYLRTESTMVVGIVGLMLSLFITFSTAAQQIGLVLLAISIGVVLYNLFSSRIHFPS